LTKNVLAQKLVAITIATERERKQLSNEIHSLPLGRDCITGAGAIVIGSGA